MLIPADASSPLISPPTTPTSTTSAETSHPSAYIDTVVSLEPLFALTDEVVKKTVDPLKYNGQELLRTAEAIPDLNPQQVEQAVAAIPREFWYMQCRTCQGAGHTMYTCPMLTIPQRIYFAYRYYLNLVRSNPALETWLNQKRAALHGGADPGPRPPNQQRFPPGPPRVPQQPAPPHAAHPTGNADSSQVRIAQRRTGVAFAIQPINGAETPDTSEGSDGTDKAEN